MTTSDERIERLKTALRETSGLLDKVMEVNTDLLDKVMEVNAVLLDKVMEVNADLLAACEAALPFLQHDGWSVPAETVGRAISKARGERGDEGRRRDFGTEARNEQNFTHGPGDW